MRDLWRAHRISGDHSTKLSARASALEEQQSEERDALEKDGGVVCVSSPSQAPSPSMACGKLTTLDKCLLIRNSFTLGYGNTDSGFARASRTDAMGAWMSGPCAARCVLGLLPSAPAVGRLYVALQIAQVRVSHSTFAAVARHGPSQPYAHPSDAALDNASIHSRASWSVLPRKMNLLPPTCAAT